MEKMRDLDLAALYFFCKQTVQVFCPFRHVRNFFFQTYIGLCLDYVSFQDQVIFFRSLLGLFAFILSRNYEQTLQDREQSSASNLLVADTQNIFCSKRSILGKNISNIISNNQLKKANFGEHVNIIPIQSIKCSNIALKHCQMKKGPKG